MCVLEYYTSYLKYVPRKQVNLYLGRDSDSRELTVGSGKVPALERLKNEGKCFYSFTIPLFNP